MSISQQHAETDASRCSSVLKRNRSELLRRWRKLIIDLPGTRTMSLMSGEELQGQIENILDTLLASLEKDSKDPDLATVIDLLGNISVSRAKQGFTPAETATFVFSLKDAALPLLQEAFDSDRAQLAKAVIRFNTILDKLGLVTFESYAEAREKVITEQSRAMMEMAEASNKAKSQFLANMSHEIRTPIQAIIGMGELLKEGALKQEEAEYVGIINRSGKHLLSLINDILDLSKIECGQFELNPRSINFRKIIRHAASIFSLQAKDKRIALSWQVDDNVPARIWGDHDRLNQILINLIGNAIKFTESGDVRVRAGVRNNLLRISVSDTGIGISQEKQHIIFEPFKQGDASIGRQFGGTGLGLAICRQLAEKMRGSISLESEIGKGSVFYFDWPLEKVESGRKTDRLNKESKVRKEKPTGEAGVFPEAKILLAEDTHENRVLFKAYLKKLPFQVDLAKDGSEAFLKYTSGHYDLVLMDVEMPIMDGYAATRAIRNWEQEHGKPRTPILALTAHAMREYQERSQAAGCDGHLSKPISRNRLIESVCNFMK